MEPQANEQNPKDIHNSMKDLEKKIHVAVPGGGLGQGVYTYRAPQNILPGTRVQVPLGNRQVIGVVVAGPSLQVEKGHKAFKLKDINRILDAEPFFDSGMMELAYWLSRYYMHPLGQVVQSMMPLGVIKKKSHMVRLSTKGYLKIQSGSDPEKNLLYDLFRDPCLEPLSVFGDLQNQESAITAQQIHLPELSVSIFARRLKKHLQKMRSEADAWCWELFPDILGEISKNENLSSAAIDKALRALSRKGLVSRAKISSQKTRTTTPRNARSIAAHESRSLAKPVLTELQSQVLKEILYHGFGVSICEPFENVSLKSRHQVFLIHGITGSGKTEVYLQLIESLLKDADFKRSEDLNGPPQVLVMVPEISLTPQMTYLFESRFPGKTAVVHSAMGDGQRWQELEKIAVGGAQILIGPRSAVLSRFKNLCLIIVDEEHDQSYKQENALRYHARDVAVVRAQMAKIPVVLGSATPSLESYQNALDGRYRLCEMLKRVGESRLPSIEILHRMIPTSRQSSPSLIPESDSNSRMNRGDGLNPVHVDDIAFHPQIYTSIKQVLERHEQVIVLVNRRGYAHYLKSRISGHVVQCSQCSISMTYHRLKGVLHCHYCDEKKSLQVLLQENPQENYVAVGDGSQKAEEALLEMFPQARIARVDSDTMNGKLIGKTIELFRKKSLDILVGTQMLAKGHDFPDVTLVVLLNIDRSLHFPDFRAGERTFQLLVQASGRAGRGVRPGRVLLQLDQSEHPVINAAINHDYHAFSAFEIVHRKALLYPPFSRMVSFCFSCENKDFLEKIMEQVATQLEKLVMSQPEFSQIRILGPAAPGLEKIRDLYRQMIILTAPISEVRFLRQLGERLVYAFQKLPRGVEFRVDVDPQNLM